MTVARHPVPTPADAWRGGKFFELLPHPHHARSLGSSADQGVVPRAVRKRVNTSRRKA